MTALDDALNTSAPVFHTPDITAEWEEDPPNEASNPNPDAMRVLSEQSTGVFTVEQSLDDALPDPVTMTSGNDASTKAAVGLNGREEIFAQVVGWRAGTASGTGTGTSIAVTLPSDSDFGDYSIVAVVLNSNAVGITSPDVDIPNGWQSLGNFSDGATIKTWVYGRRWYAGAPALTFTLNSSIAYAWVAVSAYARMANGIQVPIIPGTVVSTAEAGTGTSHSALSATLSLPGFIVGVWSSVGVTWTAGAGTTELNEASSTMDVMVSSTPYQPAGSQVLTATSASSISIATMIAIPLTVVDRPRMSARQFFSPFNTGSPLYGRDRDTALTRIDVNVLGAAGPIPTTIHRGQMADIVSSGEMSAVSKTRLDIDRSLVLPEVWGEREGMAPDWIAAWIMARGGQFIGVAPTQYTVWWDPMYGSIRAFLDADSYIKSEGPSFYYRKDFDVDGLGPYPPAATQRPTFVPGPFHLAAFACQDATHIEEITCELYPTVEELPFLAGPAQINDQFSQTNAVGRVSFWIRGDAAVSAPSYLTSHGLGGDDFLFSYELNLYDASHTGWLGYVRLVCASATRYWSVTMGSTATTFVTLQFNSLGTLPTDGAWHFVSLAWDPANGQVKIKMDAVESSSNYWAVNVPLNPAVWPVHDSDRTASGTSSSDPINNLLKSHLPISEVQIEAGQPFANDWSVFYPIPTAPSRTAISRPTGIEMIGIAEQVPITGWDTLAELARGSLAAYRMDEQDNFNFLPLGYFGETAQMTPTEVVDTEVNASDMDVVLDASKTRNVVTVEFEETSISSLPVPVLTVTESMAIRRGISYVTFTLDTPCVEIYGKSLPGSDSGGNWTFWNLSANEINGTVPPTSIGHYVSINTKSDGSGSVIDWNLVKVRIMSATGNTIVVRFINARSSTVWLVNNGDNIPFMVVRGNALTKVTGYVTARDTSSVAQRRERALSVQMPWIDNRESATIIAGWLTSILARPRPELTVKVMGDPRRKPGGLVTIADSQNTQASGTWRILAIEHNGNGPQYTQTLSLVYQLPVGLWDGAPGWDNESWGV